MDGIKDSGQAVGAQVLTELSGFAPPTIMAQAARLQARQRLFNLVVTNVPGPQFPLYMLGRQLDAMFPMVPLAENTALGIAIMSYNGQLNFGLNADYDALPDLEALADELRASIEELVAAAGEVRDRLGPASIRSVRAFERDAGPPAWAVPGLPGGSSGPRSCVAALVIAIGVIALLSGGLLAGNDTPGVSDSGGPLGVAYRDLGHAHLAQGTLRPVYDSDPPTSGPHVPLAVTRDESELNDDQLLQALEVGDVVIMYGATVPPPGLHAAGGLDRGTVHARSRGRRPGGDPGRADRERPG